MCFAVPCLFLEAYCISLCRLALLKRYWLVFFRPPWSGTARCRPGRRMVRLGLWKWAFMHYVGYSSVFIGDGELIFLFCLTTGLTATQRSSTSTVTWPRFRPSSSSWRAADHTSNVRPSWETLFYLKWIQNKMMFGSRLFGVCVRSLYICAGDRELIQEVLFDAVVTAPLEAYWTGLALNKSE